MRKYCLLSALILILGLIFCLGGNVLAYDGYHNPIRVQLASTGTALSVKVTSGTYTVINGSGTATATVSAGGSTTLPTGFRLSSNDGNGRFQYGSYEYRGDLIYNGGNAVNVVGMEQYLYGVVMMEIGGYAPGLEALKAQAVASRNLACYRLQNPRSSAYFDIYSSTSDQAYHGYSGESADTPVGARVRAAVDATKDQVMYYQGTLVQAYYMANGGGHTEAAAIVWGGSYPYLQGVSCPWDALPFVGDSGSYKSMKMPTGYEWTMTFSFADLASKLKYNGTITDITVDHDTVSGYAKNVIANGTNGSVTYTGESFRSKLSLMSASFEIIITKSVAAYKSLSLQYVTSSSFSSTFSTSGKIVTINGRGYGHSVGMSQWSACVMAYQGYNYQYILNYFYNQNQNNGNLIFKSY